MKKTACKKIADWWDGEHKLYDDPYIIGVHVDRHWTSSVAHIFWEFYLAHWQWIWTTVIALAGLTIAIIALK